MPDNHDIALNFQLPENLKVKKFLARLDEQVSIHISSEQYSLKNYYDSFDWRLYQAGYLCEFLQSKTTSKLILLDIETEKPLISADLDKMPSLLDEFENPAIKRMLSPVLEMRALNCLTSLPFQSYQINVLNKDQKTTVRILLEDYEALPARATIQPIKGYDKSCIRISELLTDTLELKRVKKNILQAALKLQGRKPLDYSSKLKIQLDPSMRADIASKYIYSCLLQNIKVNEAGTIADTDSEFLHDFRVAVRRTRSGLSQLKEILPIDKTASFSEYFAWLGQITSLTRDLDVYLLDFPTFESTLPENMKQAITPLHNFLKVRQVKAQKELAGKLKSPEYLLRLQEWEEYLKEPAAKKPLEANALLTIKQVADKRIWKVYQRVLKDGNAIDNDSPAEALHDLRKTCKKLRYLMEFFQSMYDETTINHAIKSLKKFQDILGTFQDCEVQEHALIQFGEDMRNEKTPTETFLAMGILVQHLQQRQQLARLDFSGRFDMFQSTENQAEYKKLFSEKN